MNEEEIINFLEEHVASADHVFVAEAILEIHDFLESLPGREAERLASKLRQAFSTE